MRISAAGLLAGGLGGSFESAGVLVGRPPRRSATEAPDFFCRGFGFGAGCFGNPASFFAFALALLCIYVNKIRNRNKLMQTQNKSVVCEIVRPGTRPTDAWRRGGGCDKSDSSNYWHIVGHTWGACCVGGPLGGRCRGVVCPLRGLSGRHFARGGPATSNLHRPPWNPSLTLQAL